MKEWIVPDNDIGVDGAYFDYQELLRCKDCKWHRENECYAWDDGTVAVVSETPCDGFCYRAERKEG